VKKFLETAPEKLDSLDVKATSLKTQVEELVKKCEATEETLKDFEHLDELVEGGADIAFYKKKAQTVLEQLKKLKAELNALTANINATSEEYQKLKKQVIAAQKNFRDASEKYSALKASKDGERKAIEEKLSAIAKDVDAEMMEKYKNKRKERIFPVIGKLFDKRCPFCSMEPPIAATNKLTGGGTIECDSCHRIIYQD
jgi:predicted  nucleic acid-binding Zn-ribbon protein